MSPDEIAAWDELDAFFQKHERKYKLSFGLEFSHVIDYVASMDITPRRGHPEARKYPLWQSGGGTRAAAIKNVLEIARTEIENFELEAEIKKFE
jgi:hypothetical protein